MKTNDVKVKGAKVENEFRKCNSYFMDSSFSKYGFQKNGEHIAGYNIFEVNKIIELLYIYIYIYKYRMGLPESA